MAQLTAKDINKIAHLARLQIDTKDISKYTEHLSSILNFVEQIKNVDTENIEPMAHPQDLAQRLRPDAITETDNKELFQSIAPQTEAGLYLVPKVIDNA